MEKESTFFANEKKNVEGKGGKYLEKENIFFVEEKKNIKAKEGKYLVKENVAGQRTNEQGNIELLCRWTMEVLDEQLCSMVDK